MDLNEKITTAAEHCQELKLGPNAMAQYRE